MASSGGLRAELRRLVHAQPGTQEDRDRKTLGWILVLFAVIGIPVLIFGVILVGALIGAMT